MNHRGSLSKLIYAGLIHLYPAEYYRLFGDELQQVFDAKLANPRQFGHQTKAGVWMNELCELPVNVLTEYLVLANPQMKGDLAMSANQRSRMFALSVLFPLVMAIVISLVNPRFMGILFTTGLGWLIVGSYALLLGVNAWLVLKRNLWRPGLLLLTTLTAILLILFGPALIRVGQAVPTAFTSAPTILIIALILIGLAFAVATLFSTSRPNANNRP
ncbi:MAG: hypothetical protein JW987_13180 [Anaerolineaceae bacterium]|nr:hypothetical protein [Anaerolineaceae bacterium]